MPTVTHSDGEASHLLSRDDAPWQRFGLKPQSAPPVRASESVTDPPTRLHPCPDRLRPPIHDGGPGLLPYRWADLGGRPPAASWLVVPDSSRRDDPRRSARDDAAEAMHPTMPGATMAANSQRRSSSSMMTINACAAMGATSVIIGRADDPRTRRSRLGRRLPPAAPPAPRIRVSGPSSMPSVWNGVAGMRKLGGTMWSKATELSTFRRVVGRRAEHADRPRRGMRPAASFCDHWLASVPTAPGLWLPEASSLNSSRFFASSSSTDEPTPDTL